MAMWQTSFEPATCMRAKHWPVSASQQSTLHDDPLVHVVILMWLTCLCIVTGTVAYAATPLAFIEITRKQVVKCLNNLFTWLMRYVTYAIFSLLPACFYIGVHKSFYGCACFQWMTAPLQVTFLLPTVCRGPTVSHTVAIYSGTNVTLWNMWYVCSWQKTGYMKWAESSI